jgi:hypothetical protein
MTTTEPTRRGRGIFHQSLYSNEPFYILYPQSYNFGTQCEIQDFSAFLIFLVAKKKLGRKKKRENVVAAATASHVQF